MTLSKGDVTHFSSLTLPYNLRLDYLQFDDFKSTLLCDLRIDNVCILHITFFVLPLDITVSSITKALFCFALYHIVLHCIVLYCTALYCIVLYCTVMFFMFCHLLFLLFSFPLFSSTNLKLVLLF